MASPDTTILLIVDYNAAIGKTAVPPPLEYAPLSTVTYRVVSAGSL